VASAPHAANFDGPDARSPLLVSRNCLGEKLRDALHLHVGRGRRYSVRELSDATGVPERCIEAAKCQPDDPEYRPLKVEDLASLAKFLGAPFASAFLEPCGLGAFELNDQPPLPKVFEKADVIVAHETPEEERKRLILRLAELEGVA
jgi:hypothetical protein